MFLIGPSVVIRHQEEAASPVGSDKVAEEEGEDLDDEEEYDEEEEEDDDDRPRKKPRHGGFILDEAGASRPCSCLRPPVFERSVDLCAFSFLCVSSLSRCGRRV